MQLARQAPTLGSSGTWTTWHHPLSFGLDLPSSSLIKSVAVNKGDSHPLPPVDDRTAAAFWRRVHKSDGCWLWTGGKRSTSGYGVFQLHLDTPYGRAILLVAAHRLAYTLAVGPIPPGAILLHSCDTPACVRPDHLRPGTRRENSQDMISRGRRPISLQWHFRGGFP